MGNEDLAGLLPFGFFSAIIPVIEPRVELFF